MPDFKASFIYDDRASVFTRNFTTFRWRNTAKKRLYIVVEPHLTYNICYIRDVLLFPTMKPID